MISLWELQRELLSDSMILNVSNVLEALTDHVRAEDADHIALQYLESASVAYLNDRPDAQPDTRRTIMQRKHFKCGETIIPVDISPNGEVNIGATGPITVESFARLAVSVLCASNTLTRNWVGFPICNDLEDW